MVLGLVGPGTAGSRSPDHQIPFTPRAKKLLELGLREALGYRHSSIEPEHLLLSLNREQDGPGVRVLRDAGLGDEQVRQAVVDRFASHPERFPPGDRIAAARRRSAATGERMRVRPAGSVSVEPDPALAQALRSAAARAVSEGRDQYGVADLISVLGQQLDSA
jgi:ATP-dependent Clp protease ATP-binding subunit ClpA